MEQLAAFCLGHQSVLLMSTKNNSHFNVFVYLEPRFCPNAFPLICL